MCIKDRLTTLFQLNAMKSGLTLEKVRDLQAKELVCGIHLPNHLDKWKFIDLETLKKKLV